MVPLFGGHVHFRGGYFFRNQKTPRFGRLPILPKFAKFRRENASLQGVTLATSTLGPTYFGKGWLVDWRIVKSCWKVDVQSTSFSIKNERSYFRFAQMKVFNTSWKGSFVEMTWGCVFWKRGLQFRHQPLTETRHQKFYVRLGLFLFPILRMFLFNFKESSFEHLGFWTETFAKVKKSQLQMIHSNIDAWNYTLWIS